jgi:sporulation protein YlmC with PRC-barrel domain
MVVNSRHFTNARVRTRAGIAVGKAASLDFDADTGRLTMLHVRISGVAHLLDHELLIAWAQIVSISEDEVIVEDAAVPATSGALAKRLSATTAAHLTTRGNS